MMPEERSPLSRGRAARSAGFSMIEALVAMALVLIVMALVFTFYTNTSKSYKSEQAGLDMQQAARVAVDELGRMIEQAGYGVWRPDLYNPTKWQRNVAYAGPYTFALNADVDFTLGPIDSSQTLTFPTGQTYTGQGPSATTDGAETYVFGLDADGDNSITLSDRTSAETGSYNPAATTDNPLDFAVFRRAYGYDGTSYTTRVAPITPYLFTGAVSGVTFDDGSLPDPLFVYLMTEDLNRDGKLETAECVNDVVDTCPPSAARAPLLYLWGDSDFDGRLSDAERSALRTLHVGATGWDKSPIVDSGSVVSTTLANAIDPTTEDAFIEVASAAKIPPGVMIRIGSGAGAELLAVDQAFTGGGSESLVLTSRPQKVHAAGETVEVLPESLLRAVMAVQINFTAITPRKDREGDDSPAGQVGRVTAHGMDYRTLTLQKTVHMTNQGTVALASSGTNLKFTPACPMSLVAVCDGSSLSKIWVYGDGAVPLTFRAIDENEQPMTGVKINFANADATLGSLDAADGSTDSSGLVTVNYQPKGKAGVDMLSATTVCLGETYTSTVQVVAGAIDVSTSYDCLSTVSARNPAPESAFTVQVRDESGVVYNAPVELHLEIDDSLLSPKDFTTVQADLYVEGTHAGSTDGSGKSPAYTATTGGSGTVNGSVRLVTDNSAGGLRVKVRAATPTVACQSVGGGTEKKVDFFEFNLDSLLPTSGCLESTPCAIAAGADAPEVEAVLSIAGKAVSGAPVVFTTVDKHGEPDTPPAVSELAPDKPQNTGSSGEAVVAVGNNESTSITPSNPLITFVDAVSSGPSSLCSSGQLGTNARAGFRFEGAVKAMACETDMQQAWVSGKDKIFCLHILNPADTGECPIRITGIKASYYNADGVTLDTSNSVNKIEGGAVSFTPNCGTTDKVNLFEKKWFDPDRTLGNGERWDFGYNGAPLPKHDVSPQQYFVVNRLEWIANLVVGRRMDITVYYDCAGICAGDSGFEATYELVVPSPP